MATKKPVIEKDYDEKGFEAAKLLAAEYRTRGQQKARSGNKTDSAAVMGHSSARKVCRFAPTRLGTARYTTTVLDIRISCSIL